MLLFVGFRRSVTAAMRWQDVNLQAGTWTVPQAKSKSGDELVLPLTGRALATLKRRHRDRGSSQWVFPGGAAGGHLGRGEAGVDEPARGPPRSRTCTCTTCGAASAPGWQSPRYGEAFSVARLVRAIESDPRLEKKCTAGTRNKLRDRRAGRPDAVSRPHAFVPLDGLATRSGAIVGTATVGGDLVETEYETPGIAFLNALRAQSLALQLGVEVIGGLQGELTLPYISSGLTGYWLSDESTAASESDWTLAQLPANSPKTCAGYTEVSRRLLLQSNADALTMADLGRTVATAVDVALYRTVPAALAAKRV